mgnify:CR=1 FL=1
MNIIGSSFDGIELTKKINYEYGNGVVIGIISSSQDEVEIAKAQSAGAQWKHIGMNLQTIIQSLQINK